MAIFTMPKIYLQLRTKNHALRGDQIVTDSNTIPRAGELIDCHDFLKLTDQVGTFIVQSVIYKLTGDGFVPYITARQWHIRAIGMNSFKNEAGSLGNPSHRSYDEDDAAISRSGGKARLFNLNAYRRQKPCEAVRNNLLCRRERNRLSHDFWFPSQAIELPILKSLLEPLRQCA